MLTKIEALRAQLNELLEKAESSAELDKAKVEFLGKKGAITELMTSLKELKDPMEKKNAGQQINLLKKEVEERLAARADELVKLEEQRQIEAGPRYDFTVPAKSGQGSLHPITIVQNELEEIFASMGFTIEDYDEIVDEYHNFEALNIPGHHPARDMQDTYYLSNGQLLKTHTSAAQNAIMRKYGAPLRAIFPG
ncbi:MAG: phenylalanine--tRNA ligase subunit alpha, partial [Oscillospiraceae bacterium]|nr:phenylalanine--tRNA ligase subunit alpha [Oscillospiraceae bacterium]